MIVLIIILIIGIGILFIILSNLNPKKPSTQVKSPSTLSGISNNNEPYTPEVTPQQIESKSTILNPDLSVSVVTSPSSTFSNPDTGIITPTNDGGWILNPQSTFPLTIYEIQRDVAEQLKQVLESGYSQGAYWVEQNIMPIMARYNLKCKEIDDYVKKFKPIYLRKIEEQVQSSLEWVTASDLDKEDLLIEFKDSAISSLDIHPDCDLKILFEVDQLDLTVDDILIDRYGYDEIRFYLSKKQGVHIIPAEHYERKRFERLVEVGLVIRGEDIPLKSILEGLKLKELSELVSDLNPPKFSRKAKATEYVLNVPNLKERVGRFVSFRTLFQLQPLPQEFISIDLNKVSLSWQYTKELSYLIGGTYFHAGYSIRDYYRNMENIDEDFIRGWEILVIDDNRCCPYCKREAAKKYSKRQYPKVPLHIGCRCHLSPILRID